MGIKQGRPDATLVSQLIMYYDILRYTVWSFGLLTGVCAAGSLVVRIVAIGHVRPVPSYGRPTWQTPYLTLRGIYPGPAASTSA